MSENYNPPMFRHTREGTHSLITRTNERETGEREREMEGVGERRTTELEKNIAFDPSFNKVTEAI